MYSLFLLKIFSLWFSKKFVKWYIIFIHKTFNILIHYLIPPILFLHLIRQKILICNNSYSKIQINLKSFIFNSSSLFIPSLYLIYNSLIFTKISFILINPYKCIFLIYVWFVKFLRVYNKIYSISILILCYFQLN